MNAIVAVDRNWGIGYKGGLLKRIPGDMSFFRETTLHKVVIMGRGTFESLPGKAPLPDRVNIVLSRDVGFTGERVMICRSLEELFSVLKEYDTDDVFVIGGGAVYAQLLPYCDKAYVTKIGKSHKADTYFIDLDNEDGWRLVSQSEPAGYQGIEFHYTVYANQSPKTYGI